MCTHGLADETLRGVGCMQSVDMVRIADFRLDMGICTSLDSYLPITPLLVRMGLSQNQDFQSQFSMDDDIFPY